MAILNLNSLGTGTGFKVKFDNTEVSKLNVTLDGLVSNLGKDLADAITPYVPIKTGKLRESVKVISTGTKECLVIWTADYAKYPYYKSEKGYWIEKFVSENVNFIDTKINEYLKLGGL